MKSGGSRLSWKATRALPWPQRAAGEGASPSGVTSPARATGSPLPCRCLAGWSDHTRAHTPQRTSISAPSPSGTRKGMLPNTDSGFPHPPHACSGSQEQGHRLMRVTLHLPDSSGKGSGQSTHSPQPPSRGASLRTRVLGTHTWPNSHQVKHTEEQAAALSCAGEDPRLPNTSPG